jgi:REP element-mobilizing transposase RayT
MKYNPDIHRRKSIRLKGYDYSKEGAYFITICTNRRGLYFDNEEIKRIVEKEWLNTMHIRQNVILDEFVVMPNHLHGIIVIIHNVRAYCNTPLQNQFKSPSKTIGAIVRGFKSVATKEISKLNKTPGIPVWQRNYYEHIIRNEKELTKIRAYIQNNPLKWSLDRENPNRIGVDILEDEIFK